MEQTQYWAIKISENIANNLKNPQSSFSSIEIKYLQRLKELSERKQGDFFYIFVSRENLELIGWGRFNDHNFETATDSNYVFDSFENPINMSSLSNDEFWAGHPIFDSPPDSTFKLNDSKAESLNSFISRNRKIPQDQEEEASTSKDETEVLEKKLIFFDNLNPQPTFHTKELISFAGGLSIGKYKRKELLSSTCLLLAYLENVRFNSSYKLSKYFQTSKTFVNFLNGIKNKDEKQYLNSRESYLDLDHQKLFHSVPEMLDAKCSISDYSQKILLKAAELSHNNHLSYGIDIKESDYSGPFFNIEHLFAAVLIVPNTGASKFLEKLGWTSKELKEKYFEFISTEQPSHSKTWRKILFPEESTSQTPDQETQNTHRKIIDIHGGEGHADFSSDQVGPNLDDLIGTEKEAESMARFVASKHISPPLSVGLFGDWGSGKSFFMQKMIKHVEEFTKKDNKIFHKEIVPIEFNAWHYIETNLWASLVSHIFETLEKKLSQKETIEEEKKEKEKFEKLFAELETAKTMKDEAERSRDSAITNLTNTKTDLNTAQINYNNAISSQTEIKGRDLWIGIGKAFLKKLNSSEGEKLKKELLAAQKKLGLTSLIESAKEMDTVFQEAKSVTNRSKIIFSSVFLKNGKQYIFLFIALIAVGSIGNEVIFSWHHEFHKLAELLGEASTLMATFVGWVGIYANKASNALDKIESAKTIFDESIKEINQCQQDALRKVEGDILSLQTELNIAEEHFKQARQNLTDAEKKLKEGSARGRLQQFIKEKASSEKYSKHLGIVATIRKDFETLTKLMKAVQIQDGEIKPNSKDPEDKKIMKMWKADLLNGIPKFDRIVLYIDDLDRCPAEKVVEVLQAVHLLLAFRLFVVVVGIDARWVSHSLKKVYPDLLREDINFKSLNQDSSERSDNKNGNSNTLTSDFAASSHDYLEKIFQVPYWVRPMSSGSVENYIANLTGQKKKSQKDNPPPKPIIVEKHEISKLDIGRKKREETKPIEQPQKPIIVPPAKPPKEDLKQVKYKKPTDEPKQTQDESFTLEDDEIQFMKKLSPYIGTSPRRVKRFVNTYRIIKAGIKNDDLEEFLKNNNGVSQFQAVIVQLAIIVGAPHIAPFYFEALKDSKDFDSYKTRLNKIQKREDPHNTFPWELIEDALKESGIEDTELLSDWAGWVMRYSFHCRPIGDF